MVGAAPAMTTVESVLRRAVEGDGDRRRFTLDPAFQGLPDTAHGGTVLAAFRALVPDPGPAEVQGRYLRRVPPGRALRLLATGQDGRLAARLLDGETVLVEGAVGPAGPGPDAGRPPAGPAHALPISATCFACGVDNPLGLRLRLAFDDAAVGATWRPGPAFAAADGSLAVVALTTLLDETAFWLGVLASGESGMTTELRVRLRQPVPFGPAIEVGGLRSRVRPRPDDPRYWQTEVAARAGGRLVADAEVTFVAVRGSGRRLAGWLGATNPPEVLRRVFPALTGP